MPLVYPYLLEADPFLILPRMEYLIRDLFSDDHAAGAGDGLFSVPGPGIRQDVDTESKISQTGGAMVVSAGKAAPAWGDPGRWWEDNDGNALARLAGRTLGLIIEASGWDQSQIGWDGKLGGGVSTAVFFRISSGGGQFRLQEAANIGPVLGSLANDTEYKLFLMLRSAGVYGFISGGTLGSTPTFIGFDNVDVDLFVYPTIVNHSAVGILSDALAVRDLAVLAPLYSDTFSDTSAPYLSDGLVEPSATDTPGAGAGVTILGTTHRAAANKATAMIVPGSDVIVDGDMGSADGWDEGTGWAIAAGVATKTAGVASDLGQAVDPLTADTWYRNTHTVAGRTAGTITPKLGTVALTARSTNATFVDTGRADGVAYDLAADSTFDGDEDNVICEPLALADLLALHDTGFSDAYQTCKYTITDDTQAGVAIQWDDADTPANGIIGHFDRVDSKSKLEKVVAGTYTTLAAVADTYSAGARISLRTTPIATNTVYLEYDDTAIANADISDAGIIANTLHGRFRTDNDSFAEDEETYRVEGNDQLTRVV